MLHQYPSQQYSNLTSHYSPLDNCSHLLERTFLQPTKLTELDDCVVEQHAFFVEDKFQLEMENECHAYDATPQEVSAEDDETKALVPTSVCELLDPPQPVADTKDCDTETSQLINDEQNNNHVEKSPIKNESYDYQKYDSGKEENDLLPFINLDVDTLINAPADASLVRAHTKLDEADEHELKQKMQQLTADEVRALCEDSESGFRLPGFHQAFGSTEIGRYVHPKDFIEQIESPPIIVPSQLPHPLPPHLARPGGHFGSPLLNGAVHAPPPNGAKMKSQRHPKRGKTAVPPAAPPAAASDGRAAACWNYDPSAASADGVACLPANGAYYKPPRKDTRRPSKGQPAAEGCAQPHPAYYNSAALGADDYYGCGSTTTSSSYYGGGGGCADYANCEYFRYHQQSSQYASGYPSSPAAGSSCAAYGGHSGYGAYNGYADEHCQRLQPSYAASSCGSPAASYGSGPHGQGWRGERFFPYGDQFPYGRYKQNGGASSSGYGGGLYQNYGAGSQGQYLQSAQQSYPGYGYGAHPPVPNYSYF